jgi:hypothetical protein
MLNWDPACRCNVEQALAHPYLAAFHNAAAEPVATAQYEFDYDEETDPKAALFREVRAAPEAARRGRASDKR